MANWNITSGQMGTIKKAGPDIYIINIAENKYDNDTKLSTIWFNCICNYKPNKIKTGDTVMAEGIFIPSKNPNFPYAMLIKHIGKIKDKNDVIEDENQEVIAEGEN